jgi:hypothetical protein
MGIGALPKWGLALATQDPNCQHREAGGAAHGHRLFGIAKAAAEPSFWWTVVWRGGLLASVQGSHPP